MTREKLEKYLYKKVRVTLFDDDQSEGFLRKTEEFKHNPSLFYRKKFYCLSESIESTDSNSWIFRVSHVKKIEEI